MKIYNRKIKTASGSQKFYEEIFTAKDYALHTCVDIGANIGLFSLSMEPVCKHIYAIEPHKETFDILFKNISPYSSIQAFNCAIWNANEEKPLLLGDDGGHSLVHNDPSRFEIVKCVTLVQFMADNNINHIDLLKIDAESAEEQIFADPTFPFDKISLITGECHGTPIFPFLEKNGFKHDNNDRTFWAYK